MGSSYFRRVGKSSISEKDNVGSRKCKNYEVHEVQSLEVQLVQMDLLNISLNIIIDRQSSIKKLFVSVLF